jgi:hypothetical protein
VFYSLELAAYCLKTIKILTGKIPANRYQYRHRSKSESLTAVLQVAQADGRSRLDGHIYPMP